MSVFYDENANTFTLNTDNSTYQILIGRYGILLHLYYGEKTAGDLSYLMTYNVRGFSLNPYETGREFSLDTMPFEYPHYGNGDYRHASFNMKNADGVYGCDLRYKSHRITKGKYAIPKLPAVYAGENEAETLEIVLADEAAGAEVTLKYATLDKLDVITKAVSVKNIADKEITVTKAYSGALDVMYGDYDAVYLPGRSTGERHVKRVPVSPGSFSFGSVRGNSSHQYNPFMILADREATEDKGSCIGMALLYSGNFKCEVEYDQYRKTRVSMGVNGELFEYALKPGEVFDTPELAYIYSGEGLTVLSQRAHKLIRGHICRGAYRDAMRPVLVNSWEATYFDFNGEKLVKLAKDAAELGIETLVLDDGWFGNRTGDATGLGDWYVNEEKMGEPLSATVKKINSLGMKFGLWIEPEMVSEDSDLYRTHPDWAFTIPGRKPKMGRNQLVLDFSRKEVVDCVFDQIAAVMDAANVEYIKMDMNRCLMDIYSAAETRQNAGATMYKHVLGVYDFLERLLGRYPNLLFESCNGGGGRFDAGILYYSPQIWCSDNTDAIERIKIQHGTSFCYPSSTMGAHVTVSPNHQIGRSTPLKTRAAVAMSGTFGYELDPGKLPDAEKEQVKQQIKDYKKYWSLIHRGLYFRLTNPNENPDFAAWEFASEDKKEALLNFVTLDAWCNPPVFYVKVKGLDPDAAYYIEGKEKTYTGSALMNAGIPAPYMKGEYQTWQIHIIQK